MAVASGCRINRFTVPNHVSCPLVASLETVPGEGWPQRRWQCLFVGSSPALVGLSVASIKRRHDPSNRGPEDPPQQLDVRSLWDVTFGRGSSVVKLEEWGS